MRLRITDGVVLVVCAVALATSGLAARRAGLFGFGARSLVSSTLAPAVWDSLAVLSNWIGSPDAKVVVAEFADFECPSCAGYHRELDLLRARFGDSLAVAFLHFPLVRVHPNAFRAALAAECAAAQGRFAAMHDGLFEARDSLSHTHFGTLARIVGADSGAVTRCVSQEQGRSRIESHIAMGRRLGVAGTPTFAVNGVLFATGTPFRVVTDAIVTAATATHDPRNNHSSGTATLSGRSAAYAH